MFHRTVWVTSEWWFLNCTPQRPRPEQRIYRGPWNSSMSDFNYT